MQTQYIEQDAERMIRAGAIRRTIRPARLWVSLYRLCIAALLVVEPYLLIQTSKKDLLIQPILFFATLSGFFIFHFLAFSCKKPAVRAMREYWEAFLQSYGPVAMGTGFRDLEILQGSGVSWRTIANTEMIYPGEYTESNSILRGQYRGISFESSELHTLCTRPVRWRSDRLIEYVFSCDQWTVLSLNGRYQPELQIIERGFRNTKHRLSLLARYTVGHRYFPKSLSFNLRFRVYAPNRSNAAYVLTPEVMKQIRNMAAQTRGRLMLCFVNGECHIAVRQAWFRLSQLHFPAPWRLSFRPPSIFLPFREERFAACMQRDAAPFAALVDELLRNKILFKQEVEL